MDSEIYEGSVGTPGNYVPEFAKLPVWRVRRRDPAKGELDGERILAPSPSTRRSRTRSAIWTSRETPPTREAGTGAWAGLFNTHFWGDRTAGICASLYANSLPFVTPEALRLYGDYERAVYAAL